MISRSPDPAEEPAKVLVVDDSEESLEMICEILEAQGYRPIRHQEAETAIREAVVDPPDVILLDAVMPGVDGYTACRRLREVDALRSVPIIFVSGVHEPFEKVKAFRLGAVDYLTKPFHSEEIEARIATHLRMSRLQRRTEEHADGLSQIVEEKVREISDSQMALIFALAKLSESRDDETGKHMERIQAFCRLLADRLRGKPGFAAQIDGTFLANLICASPLHDIGKVGIEDRILRKPGRLTPEEFEIMKRHSVIGAETLEAVRQKYPGNEFVRMGIEIARSHHERWDGTGYPDGLAGTAIPLSARIMGLADVYDALRSKRHYKEGFPHAKAVAIIREERGTHFDPDVADAFLENDAAFAETWDHLHS